jgi:hypothetical protein
MDIQGLTQLVEKLRDMAAKAMRDSDAVVALSFTAEGAIYVHEMMEPKTLGLGVPRPSGLGDYWGPPQYGPKFLENTVRELSNSGEIARIVREGMRRKLTVAQALIIAVLRIQRDTQERIPVEYNHLRGSAQITLERGTQ